MAPGNYDPGCGPLGGGKKAAAAGPGVYQLDLECQAAEARSRALAFAPSLARARCSALLLALLRVLFVGVRFGRSFVPYRAAC